MIFFQFAFVLLGYLTSGLIVIRNSRAATCIHCNHYISFLVAQLLTSNDALTLTPSSQYQQIQRSEEAKPDQTILESNALKSDEFSIRFPSPLLGLTLTELKAGSFPVIVVKTIRDEALTRQYPLLREGAIVVGLGDISCEGISVKSFASEMKKLDGDSPIIIKFRDPKRFEMFNYFICDESLLLTHSAQVLRVAGLDSSPAASHDHLAILAC